MKTLTLGLPILLMGCSPPPIDQVFLLVNVPAETRQPCPLSDRKVSTVKELAALATEHKGTALCANGKIAAIDEILTEAELKAEPQ